MEHLENGMIAGYWPPCKGEAPSFREYLMEEFSLEDIIGIPEVMEVLTRLHHDEYEKWLREI